jgi:hypothetical protein
VVAHSGVDGQPKNVPHHDAYEVVVSCVGKMTA